MPWPVGLPLGSVNFGAAVVTQSGESLPMRVTIDVILANDAPSKSLVFRPTGQPLVGVTTTFDSDEGSQTHVMSLPLCDTPNMGYGNGTTIVLDDTHQFTHIYRATVEYLSPDKKTVYTALRSVKTFVLTAEQSTGDIDDMVLIPSSTTSFGIPVSVPALWSEQIAAAQVSTAAAQLAAQESAASAAQAASIQWPVPGTPATFTPSAHTQASSTITDFTEAVHDAVASLLASGANVTLSYNDPENVLTVSASGPDAEATRDAIGAALVGIGNIVVTVNDAADTISISATGLATSSDLTTGLASKVSKTALAANILDYGGGTTKTAAENDAAFVAAFATGRTVFVPGLSPSTPFHISAPLVLDGQKCLVSDGMAYIVQDTNPADFVRMTGPKNQLRGFTFSHAAAPSAGQGRGIVSYAGSGGGTYYSHIENVELINCSTSLMAESGFWFSNLIEDLFINGYAKSAIVFSNTGNTGSAWTNVYVNNQPNGVPLTSTDTPVILEYGHDSVFNQLNIEHVNTAGAAIQLNSMHAITFNSLHIEGVSVTGYDSQLVQCYGQTKAVFSVIEIVQCDLAPTGAATGGRSLIACVAGAQAQVGIIHCENNSMTVAQTAKIAKVVDAGSRVWLPKMLVKDIFTGSNVGDARTFTDSADSPTILSRSARRVLITGGTAITSFTGTTIPFTSAAEYNYGAAFSTFAVDGTTPINGLRCLVAGMVMVDAGLRFTGGTSAPHTIGLKKNAPAAGGRQNAATFAGAGRVGLATTIPVAVNDILTIETYVETGSTSLLGGDSTDIWMAATYFGPVS